MDISQIIGFVQLVPLGVCLCVGYVIKHIIPSNEANKFIPMVNAFIGLAVEVWMVGSFTPEVMLIGMVSGLASSGLYDAFTNVIENKVSASDDIDTE